jgi:uncharacterized protein (DUF58 family)
MRPRQAFQPAAGVLTRLKYPVFITILLSISLLFVSCTPISSPLSLEASITTSPEVGAVIEYHAILSIRGRDVPDITLEVELPDAVEVVEGTPYWEGSLAVGETKELILKLRVNQPGQWLVYTQALGQYSPGDDPTFGASSRILLISDFESGRIVTHDELRQTAMPCGTDLSCGTPPVTSSKPLVTVTPSP